MYVWIILIIRYISDIFKAIDANLFSKSIRCQDYSINSYSQLCFIFGEKKADGGEQECRDVKNCAKFVSSRLCDALWGKQGDYRSANRHRPDRLSSVIYLKRFKHNLKKRLSKRIVNKWKYLKWFLALSKDQRLPFINHLVWEGNVFYLQIVVKFWESPSARPAPVTMAARSITGSGWVDSRASNEGYPKAVRRFHNHLLLHRRFIATCPLW